MGARRSLRVKKQRKNKKKGFHTPRSTFNQSHGSPMTNEHSIDSRSRFDSIELSDDGGEGQTYVVNKLSKFARK